MEVLVTRIGDDAVEIFRDGADVLVDRPLVIVENDHEPLGVGRNIIQRLVGDAAGEGRVTAERDDMLVATLEIARRGHAERRGKRRTRVTRAVGVMLALGTQHEPVESHPAGGWC